VTFTTPGTRTRPREVPGAWAGTTQGELMRRPLAEPMQQLSGIISDAVG
jgi:hypothetical protein